MGQFLEHPLPLPVAQSLINAVLEIQLENVADSTESVSTQHASQKVTFSFDAVPFVCRLFERAEIQFERSRSSLPCALDLWEHPFNSMIAISDYQAIDFAS